MVKLKEMRGGKDLGGDNGDVVVVVEELREEIVAG